MLCSLAVKKKSLSFIKHVHKKIQNINNSEQLELLSLKCVYLCSAALAVCSQAGSKFARDGIKLTRCSVFP